MTMTRPDERGRFGRYGGRFAPETLMPALDELEAVRRVVDGEVQLHFNRVVARK